MHTTSAANATQDKTLPDAAIYRERLERFGTARQHYEKRSSWLANARVIVFLGALACLIGGLTDTTGLRPFLLSLSGAGAVAFVVLVVLCVRAVRAFERFDALFTVNRAALGRYLRTWQDLPVLEVPAFTQAYPFARDLDVFGKASLYQLLCTAGTPEGRRLLAYWLVEPATVGEIQERQDAVGELAGQLDWRQDLEAAALPLVRKPPNPTAFLAWAEGESWLGDRIWLVWLARILALTTLTLIGLHSGGFVALPLWIVPLFLNIILSGLYSSEIHKLFGYVSTRSGMIGGYASLFANLDTLKAESDILTRIQTETRNAQKQLKQLDTVVGFADFRFTQLIYLAVQFVTLWDIHVLEILERWQHRSGKQVRGWLEALGETEALASLASLAHDNPDWTFPRIDPEMNVVTAEHLGHPLLGKGIRVANDVTLGPPGTFLLVTGSNMSGKSTLLRAVGLSIVLAQAGGPVCARSLHMPLVSIQTSMRVQDSLESGLSFYMAELKRLKQVVDAAQPGERLLVYLLDEILQGTNSAERQVAVRRVIAYLVNRGAIGAISTHDLALADITELAVASRPVHFRESFERGPEGPVMTFDYRMRPGVAPTTNALKLLELVGLPGPEEESDTLS